MPVRLPFHRSRATAGAHQSPSAAEACYSATDALSQHQLADEVGLSIQQIQKFETGINRIAASRLADIADVLKASPGDFFPATDAPGIQRRDLIRAQDVIDELIARHKESIKDLRRLQRYLGG